MKNRAIEKQFNLLDYALSSLWRRKFKNMGIVTVFAVVIFLSSLTETAGRMLAQTPEIIIQKMSAGRQEAIPLAYLDRLDGIFGIRAAVPRVWGYYFDETSGANYTVMAVDRRLMPEGRNLEIALDGDFPAAGQGEAALGREVAANLKLAGRRTFSLFRPDLSLKSFQVSGVFAESTDLLTADLIVTGLDDGRDLFAIPENLATDLLVYVANPGEISTISRKIAARLPDTRVLTRPQIHKTYKVVFGWRSGFASICLLTALAAFAILAWDKASGLSAEEKREIGILKILGWQTADILVLRFWESLAVSGLAFLGGCTAAYLHILFLEGSLFRPVLLGWSVIHPSLKIVPVFAAADLLLIFTLSVLPYLAATVIPAWRCSTVPPDAAIR
ncbi:MAG: FtsX-like permease family protein [Desulfobulbaceae bacterium]|nr:FtsX-like permease family protein [Desulfobulbaceae bacterium]